MVPVDFEGGYYPIYGGEGVIFGGMWGVYDMVGGIKGWGKGMGVVESGKKETPLSDVERGVRLWWSGLGWQWFTEHLVAESGEVEGVCVVSFFDQLGCVGR